MAEAYATGAAANVTSTIIVAIFENLRDVIQMEENFQILDTDFTTMEGLLSDINNQFQDQQKTAPKGLDRCLTKMKNALGEAEALIHRATRHRERGWCLRCCCLLCNPKLPAQIRAWKGTYATLLQELEAVSSISANIHQIGSSTAPQEEPRLQPVPKLGFIGSGILSAQDTLQKWLAEPHPEARVIVVYGMAGVGKTSLLKVVYNNYKEKVRDMFDVVIWFTVSQNFQIKDLQESIAKELKLEFDENSTIEDRKMRLYGSLQKNKKKFLLVLDDIWRSIDLIDEVGINFGEDNNGSKIIISTRNQGLTGSMGSSSKYSLSIHPLSREEGWELFRRGAFTNGIVPEAIEEAIAREIALECKGLPLAITVVAAALKSKEMNDEWKRALNMMRNTDPSFPITHPTIDAELYQKVRWSYNDLRDPKLQICFLYCAAFPEDANIHVDDLVEMWNAEGFITQRGSTYYMDIGREYIDVLVSRCLLQCFEEYGMRYRYLRVHDVLRDMAIHIGQTEMQWLLEAGQHLQHFPSGGNINDCKRISLFANDVHHLPIDFKCSQLVSLILIENTNLSEIPEGFLSNLTSLRVLDLSYTSITSLPTSTGQLTQLQFLNLFMCSELKDLPESICNLSHLQFLNLGWCRRLQSLPARIGELRNLKHLNLWDCTGLMTIPHDIFQLTSLNRLSLPNDFTVNTEDLINLSNLRQLWAAIKPPIKVGTMGPWSDMRDLRLIYAHGADPKRGDADEDILCYSIKDMKNLETLHLEKYEGVNLPNSISQLQSLRSLSLVACDQLKELPTDGSFPMLKYMGLLNLPKLESITSSSNVRNEGTLSKLESLSIQNCVFREKMLMQVKDLPNLIEVKTD